MSPHHILFTNLALAFLCTSISALAVRNSDGASPQVDGQKHSCNVYSQPSGGGCSGIAVNNCSQCNSPICVAAPKPWFPGKVLCCSTCQCICFGSYPNCHLPHWCHGLGNPPQCTPCHFDEEADDDDDDDDADDSED